MNNPLTRRDFLSKLSLLGGAGMLCMDMLKAAPVHDLPNTGEGKGEKVIILGAGLAGLAVGYELKKLGYNCIILEARDRTGGRVLTARKGTINEEIVNGQTVCDFDEGLYFNAGPSRIPHHHELTLHYCKELGVQLEVYNHINEAAYFYSEGKGRLSNKKIRKREIHNDMRGYMAEMLHKAVDKSKLDQTLTKEDADKFLQFLRAEGGLNIDNLYKASARRGYTQHPGAGNEAGAVGAAYTLADIISSGLTDPEFYNVSEYVHELQMTMMQAKGGNDMIAQAFTRQLKGNIIMNAEVKSVENIAEGVKIVYTTKGVTHQQEGDFCICTIPLPVLSNIDHNFSSDVSRAIDRIAYIMVGKMGLQFKRRFWEEDEMIYGGVTYTNNILYQLFYPSNDLLSTKGVLTGYYHFNEKARTAGLLSYKDREKLALEKGALIHPQYPAEYENKAFSVSWHNKKFSSGGWAIYSEDERRSLYNSLLQPDKQVYFAGEHLSYLNGWMAGALESARAVTTALHGRVTGQSLKYPMVK